MELPPPSNGDRAISADKLRGDEGVATDTLHRGNPMELDTLEQLYIEELKDLYSAEKQIL